MKDFESKIKESKETIEKSDFESSHDIYQKAMNKKPKTRFNFNLRYAIGFAVMLLVLGGVFTGGYFISKSVNKNSFENEKIIEKEVYVYKNTDKEKAITVNHENIKNNNLPETFSNFSSAEEIYGYLSKEKEVSGSLGKTTGDLYQVEFFTDESVAVPTSTISIEPSKDSSKNESSYKTNIQEENVDEADIVKVYKNHIFYLPSKKSYNDKTRKCFMLTEENDTLETTKVIEFGISSSIIKEEGEYVLTNFTEKFPNDLYVTDKYLVIRVTKRSYKRVLDQNDIYYSGTYDYGYTTVFEIYDIDTLDFVTSIETAGSNVSTRLIDNNLYVVNNFDDYRRNDNYYYYYPYFYIGDEIFYPFVNSIYCSSDINAKTYVSVYKITLNDDISVTDLHVITPMVNNIYSTEDNIYLIRTYGTEYEKEDKYELSYPISNVTVINIKDGLNLSGSFSVKGTINDKYWIDEKDEYIRVVTTGIETKRYYIDQKYYYSSTSQVFNYLTIFKKTEDGFIESSSIKEGIGKPGERIQSARFNDDVVTIVTFKKTDPLYYVDISDPENPVITSELYVTGYSLYQHPYKENYVIGFGYEGENQNAYKIALFDISDKTNIKEVGKPYIIERQETIETDEGYKKVYLRTPDFYYDAKALFVNDEACIFGFRITGDEYDYTLTNGKRQMNYHNYKSLTRYLVVRIDEESSEPIKVETLKETSIFMIINDEYNSEIYETYYQRLVYIGNNYYLLSSTGVLCYKLDGDNFIETKEIKFK